MYAVSSIDKIKGNSEKLSYIEEFFNNKDIEELKKTFILSKEWLSKFKQFLTIKSNESMKFTIPYNSDIIDQEKMKIRYFTHDFFFKSGLFESDIIKIDENLMKLIEISTIGGHKININPLKPWNFYPMEKECIVFSEDDDFNIIKYGFYKNFPIQLIQINKYMHVLELEEDIRKNIKDHSDCKVRVWKYNDFSMLIQNIKKKYNVQLHGYKFDMPLSSLLYSFDSLKPDEGLLIDIAYGNEYHFYIENIETPEICHNCDALILQYIQCDFCKKVFYCDNKSCYYNDMGNHLACCKLITFITAHINNIEINEITQKDLKKTLQIIFAEIEKLQIQLTMIRNKYEHFKHNFNKVEYINNWKTLFMKSHILDFLKKFLEKAHFSNDLLMSYITDIEQKALYTLLSEQHKELFNDFEAKRDFYEIIDNIKSIIQKRLHQDINNTAINVFDQRTELDMRESIDINEKLDEKVIKIINEEKIAIEKKRVGERKMEDREKDIMRIMDFMKNVEKIAKLKFDCLEKHKKHQKTCQTCKIF